jgi:hypothetical protein
VTFAAVFQGEHPDELVAGTQRRVHARLRRGRQTGSLGAAERWGAVRRGDADRHARRGRQVGVGQLDGQVHALRHADRPRRPVAVAEEDGHDLTVDELTHARDRRLEDLVEVE